MASDLNQIKMDGRLAGDPQLKEFESGPRVATVRVANNRYFKGREDPEWKERTGFFDVEAWNATADALCLLKRGQAVHIEGALGQDNWTDADGKARSRIMIEATKVESRELTREKVEQHQGSAHEL